MKKKLTHRKRVAMLSLAALLAFALAACGGDKTPAAEAPAADTPAVAEDAGSAEAEAETAEAIADYDYSIDRPINLSIVGDSCELHFTAAEYLGLFDEAGLDINWILNGPNVDSKALLASGKIDVTEGVLDTWLKPLEQGLDIRFSIGLEQGCMGAVVLADSPYQTFEDLKGKTIAGLGSVGTGTHLYLYRVLLDQGLDPTTDFEWIGLDSAPALMALENGDAEAVVLPDSMSYDKIKDGTYRWIARMPEDEVLKDQTCCFLIFSPQFADEYPGVARKLGEILYEASLYIQDEDNKNEVIKYGFDNELIIMGNYEDTIELLAPFRWEPGGEIAEQTFRDAFAAYQAAGIIDADVDVDKFVEKSFINYPEVWETAWEPGNEH
ncbi:MAG: ABC transporter substrate-binding protein [Clostridiales Family XIII bacterium]|jgi:NitT/TauT family transport system substrate-binding protein|nr:ABC transporter substrate-binding protein [Clostridiales Family XIII bacterium]